MGLRGWACAGCRDDGAADCARLFEPSGGPARRDIVQQGPQLSGLPALRGSAPRLAMCRWRANGRRGLSPRMALDVEPRRERRGIAQQGSARWFTRAERICGLRCGSPYANWRRGTCFAQVGCFARMGAADCFSGWALRNDSRGLAPRIALDAEPRTTRPRSATGLAQWLTYAARTCAVVCTAPRIALHGLCAADCFARIAPRTGAMWN